MVHGGPVASVGAIPVPSTQATSTRPTSTRPTSTQAGGTAATVPPVGLRLPDQTLLSPVVPVTVAPGGALGVPENPATLGWWSEGARPGDGSGSIVIDGHIDSSRYGTGVFAQLRYLSVGDRIELSTSDGGSRTYAVTGRRQYDKSALPAEVFDQDVGERLVLITCGGSFNRQTRHYSQNTVLYAVPAATSN